MRFNFTFFRKHADLIAQFLNQIAAKETEHIPHALERLITIHGKKLRMQPWKPKSYFTKIDKAEELIRQAVAENAKPNWFKLNALIADFNLSQFKEFCRHIMSLKANHQQKEY